MSQASLTFTLPEESREFHQAANAGDLVAALQDFDQALRTRAKHGRPDERRITADGARDLLRECLAQHGAEWALD